MHLQWQEESRTDEAVTLSSTENEWSLEVELQWDREYDSPSVTALSVRWAGDPDELPPGGLPMRWLKTLTITEAKESARKLFPQGSTQTGAIPPDLLRAALRREPRRRLRGQRKVAGESLLAVEYAAICQTSNRPNPRLAELLGDGWNSKSVRMAVGRARGNGMLTKAAERVAGGQATERAHDIADRAFAYWAAIQSLPPDEKPTLGEPGLDELADAFEWYVETFGAEPEPGKPWGIVAGVVVGRRTTSRTT